MFRITSRETNTTTMVLMLEGSLSESADNELQAIVAQAKQSGFRVELDLSGLQYADRGGLTVLHAMQHDGVVIHSPSSFVSELLKQPGVRNPDFDGNVTK